VCVCVCGTEALDEDDDTPFTDKKKSKIKLPFSTKKIMKNVGLKEKTGKEKPGRESTAAGAAALSQGEPVARAPHVPSPEVQAKMQDSEEWKAFQAMQDRISQTVSHASEKVTQMEQGFEGELSKLSSVQTASPWATLGAAAASPPPAGGRSPGAGNDADDDKSASWVGFDDTFDAAADTTLAEDDQQSTGNGQVVESQQLDNQRSEQVREASESDVINRHSVDSAPELQETATADAVLAPEPGTQAAVDEATGRGSDAVVANNVEVAEEVVPVQPELQEPATSDDVGAADTVDPFDVSNVVTALSSDRPVFEVLETERGDDSVAKQQTVRQAAEQRRERDRQLTAALIGADDSGARSRPRPRPQVAVKSANPFKISLAATNIEPALDDDVDDAYDPDDFAQTTATVFSAANPFARTNFDESETANVDSGVWDPFSGADATEFTATFDLDEQTNDRTPKPRDKDAAAADSRSQSSKSSFEEVEEDLEPLDPFYPPWDGKTGWSMFLRTPLKKKLTQNRAWKPVYVRLCEEKDATRVRVYTSETESTCLHELTLGPTFALREMQLQQFDQYTKCHTVKLEHVFYVEKLALKSDRIAPTLRDVTKVRDLKGLKDLVHKPKTTMLLSHSPQATESLKFGTLDLVAYKQFIRAIEDTMFVLKASQRGKMATSYTKDEIIVDLIDEYYADIDRTGHISYHKARVRLFCLTFLTGNPVVEIGINDKKRRGNEIVGRADIIPIKTEDWIKYEDVQLHDIIDKEEYEKSKLIKCRPPDASRFEMMRFRVRPRANVELPLQIGVQMSVIEQRHIEIRADLMIPGYYSTSRRARQVACENIQIRFPIPEALVYMFRVEKRFRYGSVHSSKKKPGRIKGTVSVSWYHHHRHHPMHL